MKKMFCFVWYIITVRQRKIFFWKQMLVSFGVDFPLYAKHNPPLHAGRWETSSRDRLRGWLP